MIIVATLTVMTILLMIIYFLWTEGWPKTRQQAIAATYTVLLAGAIAGTFFAVAQLWGFL